MMGGFKKGDRVRNLGTSPFERDCRTGVVISVTAPNPPWHNGGKPYVQPDDGGSPEYWYFVRKIEGSNE